MTTRFRYAKEIEVEIASAENTASPSSASPSDTSSAVDNDSASMGFELSTLNSELYYPYRMIDKSMAGTDVAVLQAILSARGYYTGALDGIFGCLLDTPVRKYQMHHDLVVDVVFGPMTWCNIFEMECFL